MRPSQYPEASHLDLLEMADSRSADPLIVELATRLQAALDDRAEIDLLRARQAQAKASLELVLYRFGVPADVAAALKRVLAL